MSTLAPPPSLWRNRQFLRLWTGETTSAIGSQLGALAIPFLAVTVLAASEFEIGLLGAVSTAAFLLIGLPAGAWVDRWLKRRVMLWADLSRATALATIPLVWFTGTLTIWQLLLVAAVVGVATVFFDVAYQSYIPVLVEPRSISEANSKLETTQQLARVGGPALGGILLAVVRAPVLIGIDALTYLFSFLALSSIRDSEKPAPKEDRRPLVEEIREGMGFVTREPLLRRIVLCTAVSNFAGTLAMTVLPILVLRELGLSPAAWGIATSFGAVGGLLGALFSARLARRIGEGTVIPLASVTAGIGMLLIAAMSLVPGAAVAFLIVGWFVLSFAVLVYNIAQVSFRQRICPPRLLGRMNASIRFVVWGIMPIAGLLAGVLGTLVGVGPTIWIGAVLALGAAGFVVFSPLLGMRDLPTHAVEV
jgi:MFS family permease